MKVYNSKIDWWFYIILAVPFVFLAIYLSHLDTGQMPALELFFVLSALFAIFFPIRYVFAENWLEIRCGLFIKGKIPYKNMLSFCECKMPLKYKAPVMSTDCIKIDLDAKEIKGFFLANDILGREQKFTFVSPQQKKLFLRELAERTNRTQSL